MNTSHIKCLILGVGLSLIGTAFAADINVASQFQLETTRGIGQKMAEQIVQERAEHGSFKSWDDFKRRIKGVGDKSLIIMQHDGLTLSADAKKN